MNNILQMLNDLSTALNESNDKNDKLLGIVQHWIETAETLKRESPIACEVYLTCAKDVAEIFGSKA